MCYAENITQEFVDTYKRLGLAIRVWRVENVATMKRMCSLKVDGMTDKEIGEHLGAIQQTIFKRRISPLKQLKELLEKEGF